MKRASFPCGARSISSSPNSRLGSCSCSHDPFRDRDRENAILLGQGRSTTYFAVDVSEVDEPLSVQDVHCHSSQPWPFPGSLMLGFTARATTRDIVLQTEELEDARWLTRDELRAAEEVRLPSAISIARRLIEDWLD